MARMFCVPGVVFLACALILSVLVTISLPTIHNFDIVRLHFDQPNSQNVNQIRLGIWGYCTESPNNGAACHHTGLAYDIGLSKDDGSDRQVIAKSYTRGLVLHAVSLAAIFLAFVLSLSQHLVVELLASIASFFAALVTLIAFAIDIALYVRVHHQSGDLDNVGHNTNFGPGFWMTLAQLILLLLAGCTVFFGRRHDRVSRGAAYNDSYPMLDKRPWYRRFGRRY